MSVACAACAAPLADDARFCSQCGRAVTQVAPRHRSETPSQARTQLSVPMVPRSNLLLADEDDAADTDPEVERANDGKVDPLVGRLLMGKYFVLAPLAEGGMGRLYRARQPGLDRPVVVKRLRPELVSDPVAVARFEREARAVSRLRHPNIVQVYDFGPDGLGSQFMAMEQVPGQDLSDLLRIGGPVDEARACHIGAQVAGALAEAHANGLLHRDLKPENIMVSQRRDEADHATVLDFGVAKALDTSVPSLTAADNICGTPLYMSPEQALGNVLDGRSDLYSLGIVLHQLVSGTVPFYSQNSVEVLRRHVQEPPPPVRTIAPHVSEAFERLLLRLLAKQATDRVPDAITLRDELRALEAAAKAHHADSPRAPATIVPPVQITIPTTHRPDGVELSKPPGYRPPDSALELDFADRAGSASPPEMAQEPPAAPPAPVRQFRRVAIAAALVFAVVGTIAFLTPRAPVMTAASTIPPEAPPTLPPLPERPDDCPSEMARIEGDLGLVCIDARPLRSEDKDGLFTWAKAKEACEARQLRLCRELEWQVACEVGGALTSVARAKLEWTATERWAGTGLAGSRVEGVPGCATTGRYADVRRPPRLPVRCCWGE